MTGVQTCALPILRILLEWVAERTAIRYNIESPKSVTLSGAVLRAVWGQTERAALSQTENSREFILPDDTEVHPGHGPSTTVGRERATNPFLRAGAF